MWCNEKTQNPGMKVVLLQINFIPGFCVDDECHIHGGAAVCDETVDCLAGLLAAERERRGSRADTCALSVQDQAVLDLRSFLDGTRMSQLARDDRQVRRLRLSE